MHELKYKERKWEINDLPRYDKLPTSLGQKEEDLIQTTELQGLQIDPKIQLRIYALGRRILSNKLTLELSNTIHLS